ncbi:TetR/AcrR family transcriptional regulator [Arthrobacter alpinus]|nr:TetR/AcrR family transcriptional regulator [Arthrobacter alpinus]
MGARLRGGFLPDLERATGLSRSSIYHAFGSKRGLFDAAVASYLSEIIRPRLQPLDSPTWSQMRSLTTSPACAKR